MQTFIQTRRLTKEVEPVVEPIQLEGEVEARSIAKLIFEKDPDAAILEMLVEGDQFQISVMARDRSVMFRLQTPALYEKQEKFRLQMTRGKYIDLRSLEKHADTMLQISAGGIGAGRTFRTRMLELLNNAADRFKPRKS